MLPAASALPGLRRDAPGRVAGGRGRLPELATVAERAEALKELESEVHAASSKKAIEAKLKTIKAALAKWCLPLFPPTASSVRALGATLKKGGYRSAESYLSLYKSTCERQGHAFGLDLLRVHKDCIRSCLRGLGGPTKALALPFDRLNELNLDEDGPWTAGGPVGPCCAVVAGSWFLMREVELSTSRASLVRFADVGTENQTVTWSLPASKSDQQALGALRTHGCACSSPRSAGCVFHALRSQHARLRRLFPTRWRDDNFDDNLPLFPDLEGQTVSKEAMVETILMAARKLQVETTSADQSARISGHSLRMTGAQGFARWGIDAWAIQLLGRWGSTAVLEYIQQVPLELSSGWAKLGGSCPGTAAGPASSTSGALSSPLPLSSRSALRALVTEQGVRERPPSDDGKGKVIVSPGRVWHRVPAHGMAGPVSGWTTLCGWKFSGSESHVQNALPTPLMHKWMCKRCFPTEWRDAKEAL